MQRLMNRLTVVYNLNVKVKDSSGKSYTSPISMCKIVRRDEFFQTSTSSCTRIHILVVEPLNDALSDV